MRARILSVVAVTVVLIVGGATAAAAVTLEKARWHGTFDVTQTYLVDTLNPQNVGDKEQRVQVIKSTCAGTKVCGSVKFTRISGGGTEFTYTLRRIKPGTYKGSTTYQASWWCAEGDVKLYTWTGQVDETTIITAKAQRAGRVTKYKGTLRILYSPYEVTEDVPQECQDYFAGQGLEQGERPEIKLSQIGVRR